MNVLQHPILLPMATYVFYLFAMFLCVFTLRLRAVKGKQFSGKYFKNYADKSNVPDNFLVLERHVDNQFQVPTLFLITGLTAIVLENETLLVQILAWAFVLTRFLHTYIHLGRNNILHRAAVFGTGWSALIAIWILFLF